MTYTTRQTKKNDSVLKFADMLDAYKQINADPVKEIRCGYEYYQDLLDYTNMEMIKSKKDKLYLGSLFGVKILIDPELKPNEYKIITEKIY